MPSSSPLRIVSLVPSLTETVCALGLQDRLVGCTSFCVRPKGLHKTVPLLGGTKDPDLEAVRALRPTHIIVNLEENRPPDIRACEQVGTVVKTFPKSPDDVPDMIDALAKQLLANPAGQELANTIRTRLEETKQLAGTAKNLPGFHSQSYLYFIWRNPYMVAGEDTYISRCLSLLGLRNMASPNETRYPEIALSSPSIKKAGVLILSSEPYPFRKRDADAIRQDWIDAPPQIMKADGRLLSWYGVSTLELLEEMLSLLRTGASKLFHSF